MKGSAVRSLLEGGTIGLAFCAVVFEHFKDFVDGVVGVVKDRHSLYCYFLLYHPAIPTLPSQSTLPVIIGIINGRLSEWS